MEHLNAVNEEGVSNTVLVENSPEECPFCNSKKEFPPSLIAYISKTQSLEILFRCPDKNCSKLFVGYYIKKLEGGFVLKQIKPNPFTRQKFSYIINSISGNFEDIYNEAFQAERYSLDQICGAGYRKALEFLIKDYLISKTQDTKEIREIKNEYLGSAISTRIKESNIKEIAKRAVWLGNDETHYVRLWEDKDVKDLKKLIDLTVRWIEMESLTNDLLKDMPDGK